MLGIKVWLEGENIEITGTIPVENSDIVTTSSSRYGHNSDILFTFKIGVNTST
jgi:hypothetical protein